MNIHKLTVIPGWNVDGLRPRCLRGGSCDYHAYFTLELHGLCYKLAPRVRVPVFKHLTNFRLTFQRCSGES